MKILILTGSPKKDGNSAAMATAFAEGAMSAGHEIVRLDTAFMNIGGCKACEYCHTKGAGKCIQKDDMEQVREHLDDCDMIVFASPVYFWSLSAQLQSALHRFYAAKPGKATKFAYLLSSGSPNVYDGIDYQLKASFAFMGMEVVGKIVANGEENKSEAKLEECRAFGASL